MSVPQLNMRIFWDVDKSQINWKSHANFVIVRVLERGSMDDWNEIKRYYGHDKIKEAGLKARYLSKTILSFLSSLYQIPITQFRCYTWRQSNPVLWDF